MNGKHLIERLVYSFDLEDESHYRDYADRLSRLTRERLTAEIESLLGEFAADDVHLVIDRIEIDVGEVSMEDLQDLVRRRVLAGLRERLDDLRRDGPTVGARTEDAVTRDERMLEHFVLNGRLPWWAPSTGVKAKDILHSMIADPSQRARRLFAKASHNTVVLKRLLGLADADAVIGAWIGKRGVAGSETEADLRKRIHESVRLTAPRFGRERAYEIVKYNLLADLLVASETEDRAATRERPLSQILFRDSPISGLSDTARRYVEYTLGPLTGQASARSLPPWAAGGADGKGATSQNGGLERARRRRSALSEKAAKATPPRRGAMDGTDSPVYDFRGFLLSGRLASHRTGSTTAAANILFKRLVRERIEELSGLIVSLGRSNRVRQRLLDNISSRNIRGFFSEVVPGKRDLLTWLDSVYMETQEKVRPINQTNIRVQRSVDEVTLEIFTTTDINAISNETFLRMHLRRMALKHNIRYRDLLRAMFEAQGMFSRRVSNRFLDILSTLYREVFPESEQQGGMEPPTATTGFRQTTAEPLSDAERQGTIDRLPTADDREPDFGPASPEGEGKRDYFLRYEKKSRRYRPWVEGASLDFWLKPASEREGTADGGSVQGTSTERSAMSDGGAAALGPSTVDTDRKSDAGTASAGRPTEGREEPQSFEEETLRKGEGSRLAASGQGGLTDRIPEEKASSDIVGTPQSKEEATGRPPAETRELSETTTPSNGRPTEGREEGRSSGDETFRKGEGSGRHASEERGAGGSTAERRDGSDERPFSSVRSTEGREESRPFLEEKPGTSDGSGLPPAKKFGSSPPTGAGPAAAGEGQSDGYSRTRTSDILPASASGGEDAGEGYLEGFAADARSARPLPIELIRSLPKELVRALIAVKRSGIFGKGTKALQDLVTAYLRYASKPPAYDEEKMPVLLHRVAEHLEVDPGFLIFAMGRGDDGRKRASSDREAADMGPAEFARADGGDDAVAAMDPEELVLHLTRYRHHYTAYHIRSLLAEAVGGRRIDPGLFSSIVNLLFERDARLVRDTVDGILSSSERIVDAELRSEAYRAFTASVLDPANSPFSVNRALSEVRRRVGVDRREPMVIPSRLTEAEMYFSPPRVTGLRRRSSGRTRHLRERGIIRFYNILNLDIALEEAGVGFFDNIPFSFELLLTRYRARFLEILQSNAHNAELARFFAYDDESRLFEQIRVLLPRVRTERVTRAFGTVAEAVVRLQWLSLPRDEVRRFTSLDAFPLLLSESDTLPEPSEILLGVLHRAAVEGRLDASLLSSDTTFATMEGMRRSLGLSRFSQLFPRQEAAHEKEALRAFSEELGMLLGSVEQMGPQSEALRIARLVEGLVADGTFPEEHPYAGQKAEDHIGHLRETIGTGEALARIVKGPLPAYGLSVVAGWLDDRQLKAALAHRYGIPMERFLPVVDAWLDRIGGRGVDQRDLLQRLLLRPVPATPADRLTAFNRTFLDSVMRDRYLSFGEALELVYADAAGSADVRAGLSPAYVLSVGPRGSDRWPEFYMSVLSSPSIGNTRALRVVDAWVRYFSAQPGGRTADTVFAKVSDVYFSKAFWHQREPRRMHQLLLEGTGVMKGVGAEEARRKADALLRAGVPTDLLLEHAATLRTEVRAMVELAVAKRGAGGKSVAAASSGKLAGLPGPVELTRYLLTGETRSGRLPTLIRQWVGKRAWDGASARRFLRQFPEKAAERLIGLLSGTLDLERIVLRWVAFLKASGLQTDTQAARAELHAAVLAGRLWRFSGREYIHAELFRRLDVARRLRRANTAVTVDMLRASALPTALFRQALPLPEGRMDTESILDAWFSVLPGVSASPAIRPDDLLRSVSVPRFGKVDADVLLFLETGRILGQPVSIVGSPEFRSVIERVRAAGISLFLDLPSLHGRALSMLSAFFSKSEVTEHVVSKLVAGSTDPTTSRLLRETGGLLARTPMTADSLMRFVSVYRRHFEAGTDPDSADVDGFLMEALRVREFAEASLTAARRMRLRTVKGRGARFVGHLMDRLRDLRKMSTAGFEEVLRAYLDRGRLQEHSVYMTVADLRREALSRLKSGDPVMRALLFGRSGDALSRRRFIRLMGPGIERDLIHSIHPQLRSRLVVFAVMMKRHFNLDAWKSVGVGGEAEKVDLVLQWWADARPRVTEPVEILRLFTEQLADALPAAATEALRKADTRRFSPVEKSLWGQLRALVPALVETPPEKERRLPSREEAEARPIPDEADIPGDPADGITVHNGGLVLLWPFLGRLFGRLQLTDGKVFLGDKEQARAVQLTEYLVTGRQDVEEYALSLNKLLCGAPLDFPVPPRIELTDEEVDLCQKMLQGVIRNWEKMKSTRPKTFQETFLRREARLYRLEDRWELSVERKAYDVLLDTLPWNISMIQLNWMPQRLVVHWK